MQRRTRLLAAALAATTALGLIPSAPSGAAPKPAQLHTFGPTGQLSASEQFAPPGAIPVSGDFDAREGGDILWYTAGAGGDAFWSSNEDGTWTTSAVSVSGTYTPYVGNFAGNDKADDILWYSTTGASQLWDYELDEGVALIKTSLPTVTGAGKVLIGNFNSDDTVDAVLYRPGAAPELWWDFNAVADGLAPSITNRTFSVGGTYTPVVGGFHRDPATSDYSHDILWYAPGTAADSLWDFNPDGSITITPISINGTFTPLVGQWQAAPADQILWYAPGSAADSLWTFGANRSVTKRALTINGTYTPYSCQCINSGLGDRDDILFHGAGNAPDSIWSMKGETFAPTSYSYPGTSIRGSKLALPFLGGDFDQAVIAYG